MHFLKTNFLLLSVNFRTTYYSNYLHKKCVLLGNQGVQIVHKILQNEEITLAAYSWKEQMKILYHCCKIHCKTRGFDPLVAHWLLKPHEDVTNMTIKDMVGTYSYKYFYASVYI